MNRHERRKNLKVLQKGLDNTIASRPCGECTACCMALEVSELKKPNGVMCQHAGNGCSIYPERPKSCKAYLCGWKIGMGLPEQRPDKLGLVLSPVPGTSPAHPGFIAHELEEDSWYRPDVQKLMGELAHHFIIFLVRRGLPSKILCPEPRLANVRAFIDAIKEEGLPGLSAR